MNLLNLVIVGHVDHGKSTLIGRLLYDTNSLTPDRIEEAKRTSQELGRQQTEFAYLLDHLEEERQQGVTIDTTQVFFKTDKRRYVIIDAPGHVEFVKNMVTGASQADAAVLIVDVKEGIKEQTKRHAYILSFLGLKEIIVVLNKMDLVDYSEGSFSEVRKELEICLDSASLKATCFIPICAINGDNIAGRSQSMDWYKGSVLLEALDSLEGQRLDEEKPLVFSVQDVYKIGKKRIIVGRVEAGIMEKGMVVEVMPSGKKTAIASIEKYEDADIEKACAPESVGITTKEDLFINRGDIICLPGKGPVVTNRFSAGIFWMANDGLKINEQLTIRCATQSITCRTVAITKRIDPSSFTLIENDAEILENLEAGEVLIETKKPITIKAFNDVRELGRFVFVRGRDICAGGVISI